MKLFFLLLISVELNHTLLPLFELQPIDDRILLALIALAYLSFIHQLLNQLVKLKQKENNNEEIKERNR